VLHNKACVIIGGTSGIGLSAAKALVREGANVVVVGRDRRKAKAAQDLLGARARVIVGNASSPETARRAIKTSLQEFQAFHALYHVAGGSGRPMGDGPLHEITDRGWDYTVELNLTSLFYSNRAAILQFREQGSPGSILNMTSVLAFHPSSKYFSTHAYAASKAAIAGLTRSAAAFYAPEKIRINALAPGLIETPMSARAQENRAIRKFMRTKQPLSRSGMGEPADLDGAAVFFLSEASRFVTGQVLVIDGGWSISEGQY